MKNYLVAASMSSIFLVSAFSLAAEKNDAELLQPTLSTAQTMCQDIQEESASSCNVPVKFDLACTGVEHYDNGPLEKGDKYFSLCVSRNQQGPWRFSIFSDIVDTELTKIHKANGSNMLNEYNFESYNHHSLGRDHCKNLTASVTPQTSSDGHTTFKFAYKAWYEEFPQITYRAQTNYAATFEKDFKSGIVRDHIVLPINVDRDHLFPYQNTILCSEVK